MPALNKITFPGAYGDMLAARLDMPAGPVRAYALFAHCFTGSKDIFAASRIATALAERGFAVLRFDFTGLGASGGEFANTTFSSNVQDLRMAADYMRANFRAPDLLIGHSLGGAAVLAVAGDIPEARAVATIGAPSDAAHVMHNFHGHLDEIRATGQAEVTLGGRKFTIKREFLEDLEKTRLDERIRKMNQALFVLHSPVDDVVGIENAAHIYGAAKHPKSFISLNDADHLLTRREDATYVAEVLSAAAARYIPSAVQVSEQPDATGEAVTVSETGQGKFQNSVQVGGNFWMFADEPASVGGLASGPSPYDFLKIGLGACTTMTLRMYAERRGIDVGQISTKVTLNRRHADDARECVDDGLAGKLDTFTREIEFDGPVDAEIEARLLKVAERCPVHQTLEGRAIISTKLADD